MHDHVGIKMTTRAGIDLAYRDTGSGYTLCVIVGLLITFYYGKPELFGDVSQGAFQKGCLAGTGRTYQIQDKNPFLLKQCAVEGCKAVVLGEDVFLDRNYSAFHCIVVPVLVFVSVGVLVVVRVVMCVVMIVMVMVMFRRGTSAGGAHIESPGKFFSTDVSGS
jgi:hypothetical protein